jgi:hypothetical protein
MSITKSVKKFARIERDNYPTHECAVDALFDTMFFGGAICDPCCGENENILNSAKRHDLVSVGSDLIYGYDFINHDFMWRDVDIITNPPYGDRRSSLALAFICRALEVVEPWKGRVAMLLPADFDSGVTRRHVFADHPAFYATVVLLNRVRIFNERSGTTNHSWFIWDWKKADGPSIKLYSHISYGNGD